MFETDLRPEAVSLLQEIEKYFGKQVAERFTEVPDAFANSGVEPDGTPFVAVNKSKAIDEGIIVHELCHLKLRVLGFPWTRLEVHPVLKLNMSQAYGNWLFLHLYDALEHRVFYPWMAKMGLDPAIQYRVAFEKALTEGDYSDLPVSLKDEGRALHYVEAALNVNDKNLLNRIRRLYRKKPLGFGAGEG